MQTNSERSVEFFIHDLNPWGGQDRSVLEIAYELNQHFPIKIHSYTLEGKSNWPQMTHIKYPLKWKKPALFKLLHYYWMTNSYIKKTRPLNSIYQSTGTASMDADVIQVQFIHSAWQKVEAQLGFEKNFNLKNIYHSWLQKFNMAMEHKIYTNDKKYIAISHSIKKELMEIFHINAENITVIPHGVDADYFTPWHESSLGIDQRSLLRKTYHFADDDLVLLHVGAVNHRKGLDCSIQTLSYLKKHGFTHFKLLVAGSGEIDKYKKLASDLDVKDSVVFANHSKDIRQYYWGADLFFFPSLYEPFGLVILEAMSCGLPCLVTSSSGGAELIEPGKSGLLIKDTKNISTIAEQLSTLSKDVHLQKKLQSEARAVAIKQSWKNVANHYRDFYYRI